MQGIDLLDTALAKRKSTYGAIYLHNAVDIHKPSANLTYRWLINGDWKLILPHKENVTNKAKHKGTGEIELYNLAKTTNEAIWPRPDRAEPSAWLSS